MTSPDKARYKLAAAQDSMQEAKETYARSLSLMTRISDYREAYELLVAELLDHDSSLAVDLADGTRSAREELDTITGRIFAPEYRKAKEDLEFHRLVADEAERDYRATLQGASQDHPATYHEHQDGGDHHE